MKYKIQEFTYNEETGESTMFAVSKYGELYATVKCAEQDKHLQNQWDGYRFCEYKIALQYYRYWAMALKNRYEAVYDVYKTIEKIFDEDISSYQPYIFYLLENQAKGYQKVYDTINNRYKFLKNRYKEYCADILNTRSKLRSIQEGE